MINKYHVLLIIFVTFTQLHSADHASAGVLPDAISSHAVPAESVSPQMRSFSRRIVYATSVDDVNTDVTVDDGSTDRDALASMDGLGAAAADSRSPELYDAQPVYAYLVTIPFRDIQRVVPVIAQDAIVEKGTVQPVAGQGWVRTGPACFKCGKVQNDVRSSFTPASTLEICTCYNPEFVR